MVDLGFEVKKGMAEKPDEKFSEKEAAANGGVNGRTHNGAIAPEVMARLQNKAVEVFQGGQAVTMGQATTMVFSQFWNEWEGA